MRVGPADFVWSGIDGGYNFSWTTVIAKFAEVYALPCAEIEASIGDGDG